MPRISICLVPLMLLLVLAACEPSALPPPSAGPVAGSTDASQIYGARQDNGFAVAAVPIDRIPAEFRRQVIAYDGDEPANTIIINPAAKHLTLVLGPDRALRYGIAVGRAGFLWSGEAEITGRKTWPNWTPPPEMIARRPELEQWRQGQPGGPTNPLGARALYLTTNGVDYGYRIHGTPEWETIGQNASSGCIRMLNQDVIDLYERVPDGTRVIVLTADGRMPDRLSIPKVQHPRPPVPPAPPPILIADGSPGPQ